MPARLGRSFERHAPRHSVPHSREANSINFGDFLLLLRLFRQRGWIPLPELEQVSEDLKYVSDMFNKWFRLLNKIYRHFPTSREGSTLRLPVLKL